LPTGLAVGVAVAVAVAVGVAVAVAVAVGVGVGGGGVGVGVGLGVCAQSEDLALMFEWFDSTGYAADIENLRRDFPEVKWHTFEQWARKQDWSILDQS
jgi:hypothetical protein